MHADGSFLCFTEVKFGVGGVGFAEMDSPGFRWMFFWFFLDGFLKKENWVESGNR